PGHPDLGRAAGDEPVVGGGQAEGVEAPADRELALGPEQRHLGGVGGGLLGGAGRGGPGGGAGAVAARRGVHSAGWRGAPWAPPPLAWPPDPTRPFSSSWMRWRLGSSAIRLADAV